MTVALCLRGCSVLAALAVLCCVARAEAPLDFELLNGQLGAHALEELDNGLGATFEAAMSRLADELAERPFDVVAHIDRCRAIEELTYGYEYATWIDRAYELHEECLEDLDRFADHPELRLLELERMLDEELWTAGHAILAETIDDSWTPGQIARLYTLLAATADRTGRTQAAAEYARRALAEDERSDVRLIVATDAIARDDRLAAIRVLTSPMDDFGAERVWYLNRKMELLSELGLKSQVLDIYSSLVDQESYYASLEVAFALREAGALDAARAELEKVVELDTFTSVDERALFEFEYAHGSGEQAHAAYDALRDLGWWEDPIGINRVALLARDWTLPWAFRDLLGVLGALAAVGAIALVALLPVAGVHYRGLARALKQGRTDPSEGWQLRHAWLALFVFGLAGFFALYSVGPLDVFADPAAPDPQSTVPQFARILVVESFLALLVLLPLGRTAAQRQPQWLGTDWILPKSLLIGVAVALLFRVPSILAAMALPDLGSLLSEGDLMWRMLAEVQAQFGSLAVLWVVALMAPVVEEFVFRGVVLNAFSRHVAFGWANAIQAALFAAIHMDLSAAPFLFAIGATAGWLARRSGGLAAPIAMHATFNFVAWLILVA